MNDPHLLPLSERYKAGLFCFVGVLPDELSNLFLVIELFKDRSPDNPGMQAIKEAYDAFDEEITPFLPQLTKRKIQIEQGE